MVCLNLSHYQQTKNNKKLILKINDKINKNKKNLKLISYSDSSSIVF